MDPISKTDAIKTFFNTPGSRPVDSKELLDYARTDKPGFDEVARLCADALGRQLKTVTSNALG